MCFVSIKQAQKYNKNCKEESEKGKNICFLASEDKFFKPETSNFELYFVYLQAKHTKL